MRTRRRFEPSRLAWFGVVAAALAAIGWLAVRAAVVRTLPATAPSVLMIAPHDGRTTLDRVTASIMSAKAQPSAAAYAPVLPAAADVPLDDRPFLLLGVRSLAAGQERTGVALLEEGRRRNPRQRYTRLLLLDRYLRANRIDDAVVEMAVLNRLLPAAREGLARSLAKFAIDPATARQTRRALTEDPALFNQVLVAMSVANADSATIQRFAGSGAPTGLGPAGWRTMMIKAMTTRGDYAGARSVWLRAYRIDPAQAGGAIYDAQLRGAAGGPPFNWALSANEVGAVEIGGGAMNVEYYGRRAGPLASQLIVVPPGQYRLSYAIAGSGGDSNGGLAWTVTCQGNPAKVIATSPATPLRPAARMVAATFTVPTADCPAQLLTLEGLGGGFAGSTSARVTRIALERMP